MSRTLSVVLHPLASEDGAAAVEYAVMLSLILVASISVLMALGSSSTACFNSVNCSISGG